MGLHRPKGITAFSITLVILAVLLISCAINYKFIYQFILTETDGNIFSYFQSWIYTDVGSYNFSIGATLLSSAFYFLASIGMLTMKKSGYNLVLLIGTLISLFGGVILLVITPLILILLTVMTNIVFLYIVGVINLIFGIAIIVYLTGDVKKAFES